MALNDAIAQIKQDWRVYRQNYEEQYYEKNNHVNLTDKNLDRLAGLLNQMLAQPVLAAQIPTGSHIFYGAYNDLALTQKNLALASKILLGMALGYVEDAPLMMVFERNANEQTVIDLSVMLQTRQAQTWIEKFQKQSQRDMTTKLKELLAV